MSDVDFYSFSRKQSRNSMYRGELLVKQTKEELIVGEWLHKNNIRAIPQKGFLLPFHRIVDFYIPKHGKHKRVIIEVDGGYHNSNAVAFKDYRKDCSFLKERKMKIIRISNEQVNSGMFAEILSDLLLI